MIVVNKGVSQVKKKKLKGGRPRVSKLGISTLNRKEYDKAYRQRCRYIFTVNLSQDKDSDIIDALETITQGNRQQALKILIRAGIHYYKTFNTEV